MTTPEILPVHVAAFERIARKEIERSIIRHDADRAAFWHAVKLAYTQVPVEPAHAQDVAVLRHTL